MKKFLFVPLAFILLNFSRCNTIKNIIGAPSQLEMIMALKEALNQGLFRSFDAFAHPEGNPLVRFAFPGEAEKIERTLRNLGLDKKINEITGKFNRAMFAAVNVSRPLFTDAVKNMSFRDVVSILITDNSHAATDYFKSEMKPAMIVGFRPIVDSTVKLEGADKDWRTIAKTYNEIPFLNTPRLEESLTDFISARIIDFMFMTVANEEEQIRTKYEFRKTDLMRKVFSYAEEELKRRRS